MATWTEELKNKAVTMYTEADPTPESSAEIIKDIAEELDQSPNGVRQVLIQAQVYVKKEAASGKPAGKTTSTKDSEGGTKRVSKESQLDALKKAIEAKGASVDEDIISKLTGKAAGYFAAILSAK